MKKYDEINFKELDWYVIDTNEDTTKLLLKNVLDEERIKKYSDDEFMINGHDVRHQDNIRPFDWDKSYIKNTILLNFIKDLDVECEVDLLSKEEVKQLPEEIRKCDDWYWTKTPFSGFSGYAWGVYSSGDVYNYYGVGNTFGVRPVLVIDNTLLDEEDEFIDIESFGIHYSWDYIDYKNIEELKKYTSKDFQNIFDTLDKLIKNQKKIIERLNNERD